MARDKKSTEEMAQEEASRQMKAHTRAQAINDYIRARRTPSAVSGSISGAVDVDEMALEAARNVAELRQDRRQEPRGAGDPSQTCYRNSTLFTLLCTDAFMGFVRNYWIAHRQNAIKPAGVNDGTHPDLKNDHPFALLSGLWDEYWSPDGDEKSLDSTMNNIWGRLIKLPDLLKDQQWKTTEGGRGGRQGGRALQQDAEEFLTWFLGAEALCLKDGLNDLFDEYRKVFSVGMTTSRLCVHCHDKEERPKRFRRVGETANMLQLGLPPNNGMSHTLNEVVQGYFKFDSQGWLCDSCSAEFNSSVDPGAVRDRIRDTYFGPAWRHITRLPEVMFMQLLRFEQVAGSTKKNQVLVDIPESIGFDQYIELDADKGGWQRSNAEYEVTGVISHSGSLSEGHYKTHVLVDDSWFEIDSRKCEATTFEEVVKPTATNWTPYILVWRRRTGKKPDSADLSKRLQALEDTRAAREAGMVAADGSARRKPVASGPAPTSKRKADAVPDDVEGMAPPLKRTKQIPNLYPRVGDDPRGYPTTVTRRKIQQAIDRAVNRYESKWKDWQPGRKRSQTRSTRRSRSVRSATPSPESRTGRVTLVGHSKTTVPPGGSILDRLDELRKRFENGEVPSRRRSALQRPRVPDSEARDGRLQKPKSVRSNDSQHPPLGSLSVAKRYWKPKGTKSPTSRNTSQSGSTAQVTSSPSAYGHHDELAKLMDERMRVEQQGGTVNAAPSTQDIRLAQASPVALEAEPPQSLLSRVNRLAQRRARRFRERPPYYRLAIVTLAVATFPWTRRSMPSMADVQRSMLDIRWLFRLNPMYQEAFEQWADALRAGQGNRNTEAGGRRSD